MQLTVCSALFAISLGYSATAAITTRQSQSCTYYCDSGEELSYVSYSGNTLTCQDEYGLTCSYSLTDGSLTSSVSNGQGACPTTASTVCAPASGTSDICTYTTCPPSNGNYQAAGGEENGNILICKIYPTTYYGDPSYCLYSIFDGSSVGPPGFCPRSASTVSCPGLASGWSPAYACAVDSTSSRILANPEYYQSATNTPLSCTTLCGSRGYSLAAVEYADECFCSNSYSETVTAANASDCNMPCTGNSNTTCGGGDRTQIYTNPSAPAQAAALPSGWYQSVACGQDNANRLFYGLFQPTVSNLTPARCVEACNNEVPNYPGLLAGVEYGSECYCGSSYKSGPPTAIDSSECSYPCVGDPSLTCGGSFAIQIYTH